MSLCTTIFAPIFIMFLLCASDREVGSLQRPQEQTERPLELTAASAFLAAYAHGDEVVAELAASPLYSEEWTRRGLGPRERHALFNQSTGIDGSGAPWVTFTYAGGSVDARGFQHLLYATSQPTCQAGCHASGVWRLDTEPSGRVIWAELVWLFSDHVSAVVTSHDAADLPRALLPDALLARDPRLVVVIRSATGPEGYYAIGNQGDPSAVVFIAIGPDGEVRPGVWSYGASSPGLVEYGKQTVMEAPLLPIGQSALQQSYVASLP